ncbi:MAG: cytochrome P450 [Thiohalomonadaceae bacterium]
MSEIACQDLVFDPSDPETRRNPHPIFAELRKREPVHWSEPMNAWVVTSYDLASEVLTMNHIYSAERLVSIEKHLPPQAQDAASQILRWLKHWMVFRDPPDHTRLRRHMATVLNLDVFNTFHGAVEDITNMLLDGLPRGESFDFLTDFAMQLPGMVVMDLLGVDRNRLVEVKGWSDDMMLFIGSARGVSDKYERAKRGAIAMGTLFQDLVRQRRAEPTGDVLSQLIHSEIDGSSMTDDELIGSMMMVLNGGHETTANLLDNSMMALANNRDQFDLIKNDRSHMDTAVEEFLRYDSPVLSLGRVVKEDTELGGKQLSAGERVFVMLAAANRDDEIFDKPHQLDLTRNPNPHMAFGQGPHFCMGTPLARLEGKIAMEAIVDRYDSITLDEDMSTVPWINSMVTRGPVRLQVTLK